MNKLKSIIILLFGTSLMMGCQSQTKKVSITKSKNTEKSTKIKIRTKIYPVNITKVSTNSEGNFIVEGNTTAPDKSQIVVQPVGNKNVIDTDVSSKVNDENDWAVVNKKKCYVEISAEKLSDSYVYKVGQVFPVKVIAVSGSKLKDTNIPDSITELIKKEKIREYKLIADEQVISKWNPIFKKDQLENSVNNLESDIDDNFENYNVSEDDVEVNLINNTEIRVDVKVPTRSLLMPPGQAGYMIPILKAVKENSLDPTIKYIDIDIYDDKKRTPNKFNVVRIKSINYKGIDDLTSDKVENLVSSLSEN